MGFYDRWLNKTLTQISAHWCSWQTLLKFMHCSQKTFNFFSVSNGGTSIVSDIVIPLRISHKTIFVGYFWKITNTCERCFWDVTETSPKIHLFWDMLKTFFSRYVLDVLKTSQKSHFFSGVSERSLRCLSMEMWLRSPRDISCRLVIVHNL